MRAVLITDETLPKILDPEEDVTPPWQTLAKQSVNKKRYFIQGYYSAQRPFIKSMILPERIFLKLFDFSAHNITTDWDQIVRRHD